MNILSALVATNQLLSVLIIYDYRNTLDYLKKNKNKSYKYDILKKKENNMYHLHRMGSHFQASPENKHIHKTVSVKRRHRNQVKTVFYSFVKGEEAQMKISSILLEMV